MHASIARISHASIDRCAAAARGAQRPPLPPVHLVRCRGEHDAPARARSGSGSSHAVPVRCSEVCSGSALGHSTKCYPTHGRWSLAIHEYELDGERNSGIGLSAGKRRVDACVRCCALFPDLRGRCVSLAFPHRCSRDPNSDLSVAFSVIL